MQSKVIIAAAGSGKTQQVVEEALASNRRTLILTYTNDNLNEINERFSTLHGYVPSNVTIQSWFSFLLKETVRPYQNIMCEGERVSSLNFDSIPDAIRYVRESDTKNYYLTKSGNIYKDRISDFAYKCNERSGGFTIERLEKMYDIIYIDEVQDMCGWDLDLLSLLIDSRIDLVFVGDVRQATYSTNNSLKNKGFKGAEILKWFRAKEKKGKCKIEHKDISYRCNQAICDFADALYPSLESTKSANFKITGHDGIFYVPKNSVAEYVAEYNPQMLRSTIATKVLGTEVVNYGQSKGQTFDRVLIYPTGTIEGYLKNQELEKVEKGKVKPAFDIAKFYVAVTRARYSVGIVTDELPIFRDVSIYNVPTSA